MLRKIKRCELHPSAKTWLYFFLSAPSAGRFHRKMRHRAKALMQFLAERMGQCATQWSDPVFLLGISFLQCLKACDRGALKPALLWELKQQRGWSSSISSPELYCLAKYLNSAVISACWCFLLIEYNLISIILVMAESSDAQPSWRNTEGEMWQGHFMD